MAKIVTDSSSDAVQEKWRFRDYLADQIAGTGWVPDLTNEWDTSRPSTLLPEDCRYKDPEVQRLWRHWIELHAKKD